MQRNSIAGEAIADPHSQHFMDRFCDLLQARNILDSAGVQRARRAQQQSGERFDLVLMRLGLITDYRLAEALAEFCGYRLYSRGDFPDEAVLPEKLQLKFLKANRILPIGVEPGVIRLAVADPFNAEARSALSFLLDRRLECGIAPEGEIDRAIDRLYGHGGEREEAGDGAAGSATEAASEDDVRRLEDMASEAPVIKLVRRLIVRAVEAQASDIHVEPLEDCVQVRFRIDGVLHVVETLSLGMRAAIVSRIKIMARLNIAERRLPQDGRIKENVRGREVDLRVSTMPTMCGESVVMRILDRSSIELDFPSLGFAGASLRGLRAPAARAERHHPRHRTDRQRQDHDALHGPAPAQQRGAQDLHRRGSDRVPARRHQPDPGAAADRPDLRQRAALDPAPGPRHHHGRRDPRPGDRARLRSRPR